MIRTNHISNKILTLILFSLFFIIPLIVYIPYIKNGLLPFSGDGIGFVYSQSFIMDSFRQGEFPLWNKYLQNGVPYSSFNLPLFIFYFLPTLYAAYAYYAFCLAVGAIFTYLYLKLIGCKRIVAICTALLFELSIHLGGVRKSHIGLIVTITYLPVILYFIERHFLTKKRTWLVVSSTIMAIQFYVGFLQQIFYTDVVVFVYFVVLGIRYRYGLKKLFISIVSLTSMYLGLICLALFPLLGVMTYYSAGGSSATDVSYFQSYSIHFIKLLMMIFPKMYGINNIYRPLPSLGASEMDIEIFFGVAFLFIMFLGTIRYRNDFRVKLSIAFMIIAFVYAANTHIPYLREFLYKLPIISGFRVPSRALFIFTFFGFVLFSVTLSKLCDLEHWRRIWVDARKFLFGVIGVALITCGVYFFLEQPAPSFDQAFLPAILLAAGIFYISWLIDKHLIQFAARFGNAFSVILCTCMVIITLVEVLPYTTDTQPLEEERTNPDELSRLIALESANYKAIDAVSEKLFTFDNIFSGNRGMLTKIPTINAYSSFNNPNVYKSFSGGTPPQLNYSGALINIPKIKYHLQRNDVLSMLGVKYILDSSELIADDGSMSYSGHAESVLLSDIDVYVSPMQLFVWGAKVPIEENTYYQLSFTATAERSPTELKYFYFDFYGGINYDFSEQNPYFSIKPGTHDYTAMIYSGDTSKAVDTHLRIVSTTDIPITVENITLEKFSTVYRQLYEPYSTSDSTRMFINTQARDILYIPDKIFPLYDVEELYSGTLSNELDKVSYAEGLPEKDLSDVNSEIYVEYFNNNSIKARVTTDATAFLNFSQNYYPGWKAYVNGEETLVYMVNGAIQGIMIPPGHSIVEFRYTAPMIKIGGAITGATVLIIILFLLWNGDIYIKKRSIITIPRNILGRNTNEE